MSVTPKVNPALLHFEAINYGHANDDNQNQHLPIIDCSLGTNPFVHFNTIAQSIEKININQVYPYQSPTIFTTLRKEILSYFHLKNIAESNIFFGHGSILLLERLATKFINPNGTILGISPQFCYLINDYVSIGGKYEDVCMLDGDFSIKKIEEKLQTNSYNAFYIDNPNNPTGNYISTTELENIMSICDKNGTICIIDEAYGDFIHEDKSALHYVHKYSNLVVIRSFAKGFGVSSIRSGFMAMSDNLAELFSKVDHGFEPSYISAVISMEALQHNDFLVKSRAEVKKIKEYLIPKLQNLGFKILPNNPEVSIFTVQMDDVDVFKMFGDYSILTSPGYGFSATTSKIDNSYTRILVPKNLELAQEVVSRISQALVAAQ